MVPTEGVVELARDGETVRLTDEMDDGRRLGEEPYVVEYEGERYRVKRGSSENEH